MKEMTDGFRRYLNAIGTIPLLDASEELRLGTLVIKGDKRAGDHVLLPEANLPAYQFNERIFGGLSGSPISIGFAGLLLHRARI